MRRAARILAPRGLVLAGATVLTAAFAGCAGVPAELRVRGEMAQGRYQEAAEAAAGEADELLRHLDRALALRYAGDGRASNLHFARAEQLADERYTRSLSRAALSLLLNDTVLPYQPDPWERLLVPLYRGLNHVASGEPQDAAVEARRLAALLLERRDADARRAREEGDAFLSSMAGLLFEWAGRPEDARVAYRNAAESYAAEDNTGAFAPWVGEGPVATRGELAVLVERGFVAAPAEEKLFLLLNGHDLERGREDAETAGREVAKRWLERASPRHDGNHGEHDDHDHDDHDDHGDYGNHGDHDDDPAYLLAVALRTRPVTPEPPARVTLEVDGRSLDVPAALDLSHAAALTYQRELPALLAKTAARALAKTLAFRETTQDEDLVVRLIANALHVATEKADLRAWLTLPADMRLVRLPLTPGRYGVRLRFLTGEGSRTLDVQNVEVVAGRPTIVAVRGP